MVRVAFPRDDQDRHRPCCVLQRHNEVLDEAEHQEGESGGDSSRRCGGEGMD